MELTLVSASDPRKRPNHVVRYPAPCPGRCGRGDDGLGEAAGDGAGDVADDVADGAVAVARVRSGTRVVVKQNPPTSPAGT